MTATLFDLDAPRHASAPSSTPRWLAAYETEAGAPARLAGCRAVPATCRTCGRWTLTGYDAPLIADLAVVDPYLAQPRHEAAAVLLALPTYRLWGAPGRYSLTARHYPSVTTTTYESAALVPVVIAHTCHPPIATEPLPVRQPRAVLHGDVVPF